MPLSRSISLLLIASASSRIRILRLLRVRDAAQLLDVLLAIEIDVEGHASYRSHRAIRNKSFPLDRDR